MSSDSSGNYYFDLSTIVNPKPGTEIIVKAVFEVDGRTLTITASTNGTVKASATNVKAGDQVTLNVTPASGYTVSSISYTYTNTDGTAGSGTVAAVDGAYVLTVPATKEETASPLPPTLQARAMPCRWTKPR